MTTPSRLLSDLEPLTHDARMQRMVKVGQAASEHPRTAQAIAALQQGGFYERFMALQSCYGSKDGAAALRALSDPSRAIQGRSLKLIAMCCDDAQVHEALQGARPDLRLRLLSILRYRGRQKPIDKFLDALARSDPGTLAVLLPFASARVVNRHFGEARPIGGERFWRRLSRIHPDIAVARLNQELEASPYPDARLLWEASVALDTVAKRHPNHGLKLATLLIPHGPGNAAALGRVAIRHPSAIADLVIGAESTQGISLARVAHRLDESRLLALLERQPHVVSPPQQWLRRLPPSHRARIFEHAGRLWRNTEGCLDAQMLRWLPRDQRVPEARRHQELPVLATRPIDRLAYASFLPWEEARQAADPFLNHPEPELRSAALQAVVAATRFDRGRLKDALTLLRARRHEQDPVRCAMLTAVAQLPPGIWKTEHLADLSQIIRDALSAADLSYGTASWAQANIIGLLPFHPDWSAEWIVTLVRERGQVHLGPLEQRLTEADVRRIAPALAPVLKAWQTREREYHLVALAQCLGRRVTAFDALMDILRRLLRDTRERYVSSAILQIIAQHCRDEMKTLAPALIKEDPSWITQLPVLTYLHRRRQDLLTPFLGQKAYRGRFSTGKTRYVLPLRDGFFRWTPAQQNIFAKTLDEVTHVKDTMRDIPTILFAVGQMAALPALEPKRLAELASDKRPAVQEGALRALGKLDAGQGVPTLIEALADDRARVAIYALRKALLTMPVSHALQLLGVVPLAKVTVAKEYVRLLGDMPGEEVFEKLKALDATDLHRDVRVALLRALWGHLEQKEAWPILDRAVASPDPAFMTAVVRIPTDRLSEASQERLLNLLAKVMQHPDATVRVQVLQRCIALPLADRQQILLPRFLQALQSAFPDERNAAATAVFQACRPADADRIADEVGRAMLNRRAIIAVVNALQNATQAQRGRFLPIARRIVDALASDPLTVAIRVELGVRVLPVEEAVGLLSAVAESKALHADALHAAARGIHHWLQRPDRVTLEALEDRLASSRDANLRRLAVAALVASAQLPGGWNDRRLERLRAYRQDKAPLVGAAAHFVLPEEELVGRDTAIP